ncbi:bifunctional diguanylate cyclase/phosphodiesterase [Shimia sp. R9_1]|uniref:putative bifunctional diguanylate cyclase/phosphodiesterase n=1 Tax=Shimia sp. R9_1 TaxID=2821111 RepID=UPI001ADD3239|nr:bifunctional diguanylate cyclase/phosphodiesterase [Shimia sp. R9_1]MBO9407898.1 bifunctional diguanylate cyclase/phosphodiesterase [Shimia sp. R9_1]
MTDLTLPTLAPEKTKTLLWSIAIALGTALIFFAVLRVEENHISKHERLQLVEMTDSFVAVFSDARGEDSPIPAHFRRLGIEHFSSTGQVERDGRANTQMRMPGLPGLELGTSEDDPRLSEVIAGFSGQSNHAPVHEQHWENGRLISRTLVPSIAEKETCVSCHNTLLGEEVFHLGDAMGAYVVERDMTANALADAKYAAVWFFGSLAVFWLIGFREHARNLHVLQLKSQVKIEEMKNAADAKEKFLLSHDPLTGLPNRKLFNEHLRDCFDLPERNTLTAALVDLDDFKLVNDTMGHAAGDALLVEVAQRLKAATRDVDAMVARLGGDEFALIWNARNAFSLGAAVAPRMLAQITRPMEFENWSITPKCSIGLACADQGMGQTPSELLKAADAALYSAKGLGKNTYQEYDKVIDASLQRQKTIAARLPDAIRNGDIRVALQPQVNLSNRQFRGFEALARWRLDGEDISPDEFITIAESSGVVKDLDLYVLKKAARFARTLSADMGVPVPISVNVSAKSFRSLSLAEDIQDILWTTGFNPELLTLEVTETAAMEKMEAVQATMGALRKQGVRSALDDFGTGYSSLAYLLRMEFDEIKIDREFVRDIHAGNDNHILVRHLADMLCQLDIDLVVEGIETEEQIALLHGVGNRVGQGYLFSRPLELENVEGYLRSALNLPDGAAQTGTKG